MSEHNQNQDPCADLPGAGESLQDNGAGDGQGAPPVSGDQDTALVDDQLESLFPEFEIREAIDGIERECVLVDQQHFYSPGYQYEARYPADAFSSFFRYGTVSGDSLSNKVDQFRYSAGRVYEFQDNEMSGKLQLINSRVDPGGYMPYSSEKGVLFGIQGLESTNIERRPNSAGLPEQETITNFQIVFKPDAFNDVFYYQPQQEMATALELSLAESMENFFKGFTIDPNPRDLGTPLVPKEDELKLDHTFRAPTAFFQKEVENSTLQIQDSVSIESVVTHTPEPDWNRVDQEIRQDNPNVDLDEGGYFNFTIIEDEEQSDSELPQFAVDVIGNYIDYNDSEEQGFQAMQIESGTELQKQSLYRKYNIDFEEGSDLANEEDERYHIFPSDTISKMIEANSLATDNANQTDFFSEASSLLREHVKISFSMHHNSDENSLSRIFKTYKTDTFPNAPTFFTQVIDQTISFPESITRPQGEEQFFGLNDKLKTDYRPQCHIDILRQIESFQFNITTNELNRNVVDSLIYPMSHYDFDSELGRGYFSLILTHSLIKEKFKFQRDFQKILKGDKAPSEVIGYRVEKINADTKEVMQDFYIFNDPDVTEFDFLDTQVLYSGKYTYRIYTINFVVGNQYGYKVRREPYVNLGDADLHGVAADLQVKSVPIYSVIESPYFEQTVTVGDRPPLAPEVNFIPFLGMDDQVEFEFRPSTGDFLERPISILPEDEETIQRMLLLQIADDQGRIRYSNDSTILKYQILSLDEPPSTYQDFSNANVINISGRAPGTYLRVVPNKDYYITFRSIDSAGISNPSQVYNYRINSFGNGITHTFEVYEMLQYQEQRMVNAQEVTFENALSVRPAPMQRAIDFSNIYEEGKQELTLEQYNSAPDIESLSLGLETPENSLWNKKFKFRLISRTTGKAIDFNMDYQAFIRTGNPYSGTIDNLLSAPRFIARAVAEALAGSTMSRAERREQNRIRSDRLSQGATEYYQGPAGNESQSVLGAGYGLAARTILNLSNNNEGNNY